MLDVRETAKKTIEITSSQGGSTAIVFGRENSGLTNAEMDKCNYLGYIPSNPAYSSLNIAAAVQVFAYECLMQLDQSINHVVKVKPEINTAVSIDEEGYKYTVASSNQLEGFYDHLFQALQDIDFLDPNKNALFMRRMRRLFNRAQLDVKEIDILRGILTATQRQSKKLKQCN
jgi:TrmH family RNA methyltransferase